MEVLNNWLSNKCSLEDINKYFFGIRDKSNNINYKLMEREYGYLSFRYDGLIPNETLEKCSNRIGIPMDYLLNRGLCETALFHLKLKNDNKMAKKYYRKAIKFNSAEALFGMSLLYCEEKDIEKAIKYGEKSALEPPMIKLINQDKLYPNYRVHEAQYQTGHLYAKFKKDFTKCFCYYLLSAESGNIRGNYLISCMYKKGVGCEKNEEFSKKYLLKATSLVKCKY
ncbi:hypothetical protein ACTA71_006917 [Dictyostelium dimigraforme]